MTYEHVLLERHGPVATITMNRPERRNALSLEHLRELREAFQEVGATDATGIVLAGNGPVFSAGHDFADMAGASLEDMRRLLTCTEVTDAIQSVPQVVIARVHALAASRGLPAGATCDPPSPRRPASPLPVARGAGSCTTPMVAIGRTVSRKGRSSWRSPATSSMHPPPWRGSVNWVVPTRTSTPRPPTSWPGPCGRPPRRPSEAGLLHPDRHGPAPGVCLRGGGHGCRLPDARRPEGVAAFLDKRPARWA
ncbi:MAG: enoyl-CoA hydratase-related protein [Acidimicrobiales bacterium]